MILQYKQIVVQILVAFQTLSRLLLLVMLELLLFMKDFRLAVYQRAGLKVHQQEADGFSQAILVLMQQIMVNQLDPLLG